MNEPDQPPDWSESDQRTQEMLGRLKTEDPITAGLGLGMAGKTMENLGGVGDGGASFAFSVTFDVWENGVLVQYDVPASNRRIIGTFP